MLTFCRGPGSSGAGVEGDIEGVSVSGRWATSLEGWWSSGESDEWVNRRGSIDSVPNENTFGGDLSLFMIQMEGVGLFREVHAGEDGEGFGPRGAGSL